MGIFRQAGIDATDIQKCVEGAEGAELARKMLDKTAALEPPHKFVPWVVIDGNPACTETSGCDLVPHLVCQAYTGTAPSACSKYVSPPSPGEQFGGSDSSYP